jgi:hypothetical protein
MGKDAQSKEQIMNIWQEIEIEWNGETYTIKPTLEFINHLESKPGRSLSQLFMRLTSRDLPSGVACELVADSLQWAGVQVTGEQIYLETAGLGADVLVPAASIITGCLPQPKSAELPQAKKGQARKKK